MAWLGEEFGETLQLWRFGYCLGSCEFVRFAGRAHPGEQLDMRLDDPITGLLVRLERPDAAFGCTAESDPITSRHHVNPDAARPSRTSRSACRLVVDLGLRYEMSELAFERDQLLVAEECARAKAGTVDDDRFAQGHQIARRVELTNDDPASKEKEVANERVQINGRLNPHGRMPNCVLRRKRMLAGLQDHLSRAQLWREQVVRTLLPAKFIGRTVAINPRDAVIGTGQKLELRVRDLGRAPELRVPVWSAPVVFDESGCRCEAGK